MALDTILNLIKIADSLTFHSSFNFEKYIISISDKKTFVYFIAGDLISAGEQFDEAKALRANLPTEFKNEMVNLTRHFYSCFISIFDTFNRLISKS